jgi:hypothetical protein
MLVSGTAAVDDTIAAFTYLNREVAFIAGTETSFVGYPQTEVGVPFPTLNEEVEVKH